MIPQLFIVTSIASNLEKIIEQNLEAPSFFEVIINPSIYIPLIVFFVLVIITIFARKIFYNNTYCTRGNHCNAEKCPGRIRYTFGFASA